MSLKNDIATPSDSSESKTLNSSSKKKVKYALSRGAMIGSYEIEKVLGHGGMGEVYLARHTKLDIHRAIKVLLPEIALCNPVFAKRFMREAKLAIKIQHPNIINVMDADYDQTLGIYYIVMEYVDGGTLRSLVRKNGPFDERSALEIVLKVGEALAAADALNIVHRDIKPDNIMLTPDNAVKLADLGIAKSLGDSSPNTPAPRTLIGTPAYVAPEQARDPQSVDCRADIYSLGVTLYEILSGEKPYKGTTTVETLEQIFNAPVPDIKTKITGVSAETARLLRKMMAKEPSNRPRNWEKLCGEVKKIIGTGTLPCDDANALFGRGNAATGVVIGGASAEAYYRRAGKRRMIIAGSIGAFFACLIAFMFFTKLGKDIIEDLNFAAMSQEERAFFERNFIKPPLLWHLKSEESKKIWQSTKVQISRTDNSRTTNVTAGGGSTDTQIRRPSVYVGEGTLQIKIVSRLEVEKYLAQRECSLEIPEKELVVPFVPGGSVTLPAGQYEVILKLPGFEQYPEKIDLKNGENISVSLNPRPLPAKVKIICAENDFSVWDGVQWVKKSELEIPSLERFDLAVKADSFRTSTSTLTLEPGAEQSVSVVLRKIRTSDKSGGKNMADANAAFDKKEYATASKLYREEAENGNPHAAYRLGVILENGYGHWFDDKKAAYRYYLAAAEQDNPDAIYKVAEFNEKGLGGLERNQREAISWYKRGTEHEHLPSLIKTGELIEKTDSDAAASYYRRAAALNDTNAKYLLGRLYHNRLIEEKRLEVRETLKNEARYWYGQAAQAGSQTAKDKLKEL